MLYFSKILCISLSMLSKFESHRIKGLGDMIFQNYHENAKRGRPLQEARQKAATQLRRQPRSLRGRQAGVAQLRRPCAVPCAEPCCQAKRKRKKKKFYTCKPT